MATISTLRKLSSGFPETTEEPHFEKTSFRVRKKIFATYDAAKKVVCIKLSEVNQHVFVKAGSPAIYPVENKWGKQGWTIIELEHVTKNLFADAITTAYCDVAPKKLAEQIRRASSE